MSRRWYAFVGVAAVLAGCGDTIVNEERGIACVQTEECPFMGMVCTNGLCLYPPEENKFYLVANTLFEHTSEQGTVMMVYANRDAVFTATVAGTNVVLKGSVSRERSIPLPITGLLPGTPYLVRFEAHSSDGEMAESWSSFKTLEPRQARPAGTGVSFIGDPMTEVINIDFNLMSVSFTYALSNPGRLYTMYKSDIDAPDWQVVSVSQRLIGGRVEIAPLTRFKSHWFFLQVRNDNDEPTDSRIVPVYQQ